MSHWIAGAARRSLPLAAALLLLPAPGMAGGVMNAAGDSVRLSGINRAPQSGAEAQRVRRQLVDAAMDVCGASPFSVRDLKIAVRGSSCWRDAYADAAAQVRWPADQRDMQVAPD